MTVDRENGTMKLILENGLIISESFTPRPKQNWPSGCPANMGSTRMEVLDLDVDELSIGSIVITKPVLVRNCPRNPERVLFREDGKIGGSGTTCAANDKCIHFKLGAPSESMQSPRELSEEEKDRVIHIALPTNFWIAL